MQQLFGICKMNFKKNTTIEERFNNFKRRYPNLSSYICFAKTIKRKNCGSKTIEFYFNKLVDKDDYRKGNEKLEIIEYLKQLTISRKTKKNTS